VECNQHFAPRRAPARDARSANARCPRLALDTPAPLKDALRDTGGVL